MAEARAREPIARLEAWLTANGTDAAALTAIATEAEAEMTAAQREALAAPWPDVASAFADVLDIGAPTGGRA
jgi:TPP-dependent pyruvate/acetoin dehydrogenase alpha subunit